MHAHTNFSKAIPGSSSFISVSTSDAPQAEVIAATCSLLVSVLRVTLAVVLKMHEAPPTHPGYKPHLFPHTFIQATESSRIGSQARRAQPNSLISQPRRLLVRGRLIARSPCTLPPHRPHLPSLHHPESVQLPPSSSYASPRHHFHHTPQLLCPALRTYVCALPAGTVPPPPRLAAAHQIIHRCRIFKKTIAMLTARYETEAGIMHHGYVRGRGAHAWRECAPWGRGGRQRRGKGGFARREREEKEGNQGVWTRPSGHVPRWQAGRRYFCEYSRSL
ncbi:hypothetical protein BD779DRAFT_1478359 [Infundibulicybe gibba]|nr:hypothetical protein BD779DRAFT_1478359 [Infundibulicybe gibba]